jgi:hypothetical protein
MALDAGSYCRYIISIRRRSAERKCAYTKGDGVGHLHLLSLLRLLHKRQPSRMSYFKNAACFTILDAPNFMNEANLARGFSSFVSLVIAPLP